MVKAVFRAAGRAASGDFWRGAALAIGMLMGMHAAMATDHALLIGVSDYPNLPRRLWLRAPGNDVALMHEVLIARGFKPGDMQRLVSRAGGAQEPTRQNILAAMHALQQSAQPGDRVLLYLAGHGSQQPQPANHGNRPTEPDGLDEVFLPADTQRWSGDSAEVEIPNAVLDDEIGEWMDAVVDRGATVWAIFDTCHAAGMARGRDARARAVAPTELGLPEPRGRGAVQRSLPSARGMGRTDGRALAFAASTHESTGEEWMPRGAPLGAGRLHGVFTFHLAAALKRAGQPTLLDLQRIIRDGYAREHRAEPTPQFSGAPGLRLP